MIYRLGELFCGPGGIGWGATNADIGNDDFRNVLFFGVGVIIVVAVDEHDRVRVLLDGAGFAEVREHRTLVGSRFICTRKLAQAHDRHVQLLRHDLERS